MPDYQDTVGNRGSFICIQIRTETDCEDISLNVRKELSVMDDSYWKIQKYQVYFTVSLGCRSCLGNPAHTQQPTRKCAHAPQSHLTVYIMHVYTLCA